MRGAAGSGTDQGGINPKDIGLGTRVASIAPIFSQGTAQITGRATNVAIQGNGFFMRGLGSDRFYTRAGSFMFDEDGKLTAPDGLQELGWTANGDGNIDTQAQSARFSCRWPRSSIPSSLPSSRWAASTVDLPQEFTNLIIAKRDSRPIPG